MGDVNNAPLHGELEEMEVEEEERERKRRGRGQSREVGRQKWQHGSHTVYFGLRFSKSNFSFSTKFFSPITCRIALISKIFFSVFICIPVVGARSPVIQFSPVPLQWSF